MPYQEPNDIDPLFDDLRRGGLGGWGFGTPMLGSPFGRGGGMGSGLRAPMVDVIDEGDRFVLTAELPGVRKEDIRVQVRGDVVRLHAERSSYSETQEEPDLGDRAERALRGKAGRSGGSTSEAEGQRASFVRRERTQMVFDRTIRLPEEAREGEARARFANGVLTLTIPKASPESGGNVRIE